MSASNESLNAGFLKRFLLLFASDSAATAILVSIPSAVRSIAAAEKTLSPWSGTSPL
jgi:hypothetical protein